MQFGCIFSRQHGLKLFARFCIIPRFVPGQRQIVAYNVIRGLKARGLLHVWNAGKQLSGMQIVFAEAVIRLKIVRRSRTRTSREPARPT